MKVFCVYKTGGDYGIDYIDHIYNSLKKYAPDVKLVSLSDDPNAIGYKPLKHNWPGWWSKMELFRPDIKDDILYIDLDTIICNSMKNIIDVCKKTKEPIMLADFYKKERLASGVMWIPHKHKSSVWKEWTKNKDKIIKECSTYGDQKFIGEMFAKKAKVWQDLVPNEIVSYKVNCTMHTPNNAVLVCYHGKPRPRDTGWATTYKKNKFFSYRPVAHHEKNIIIVGSGPSIKNFKPMPNWKTIAVNNSISLRGFNPNYWFTLDPSQANRNLMMNKVPRCYYYAAVPPEYGSPNAPIKLFRLRPPGRIHYLERVADTNNKLGINYGLSDDTCQINTGNSAYGALGLAYLMNAKNIILIGVDGTNEPKFYGKKCNDLSHMSDLFASAIPQLEEKGIRVVNCSMNSAIDCFEKMDYNVAVKELLK